MTCQRQQLGTVDELWQRILSDWDAVVQSLTVAEYTRQQNAFKTRHQLRYFALQYVKTVGLRSYTEQFVNAWTHHHLHFTMSLPLELKAAIVF